MTIIAIKYKIEIFLQENLIISSNNPVTINPKFIDSELFY